MTWRGPDFTGYHKFELHAKPGEEIEFIIDGQKVKPFPGSTGVFISSKPVDGHCTLYFHERRGETNLHYLGASFKQENLEMVLKQARKYGRPQAVGTHAGT